MNFILSELLSYILLYRYVALFLIIFSSAILIPFPTDTLLVAVGAFSSQGYFDVYISYTVALSANVIGDIFSYYFFKFFGRAIIREKYAKKYSFFVWIENYIKDHAGLTVFASRFVGIFGPIVNFLSGYTRISFGKFISFDILGNVIDTIWPLALGFFVGSYWENISDMVAILGGILATLAVMSIILRAYIQNRK